MRSPSSPADRFERVREIPISHPPSLVHAGWLDRFAWLLQGTTTRGPGVSPYDLGLFTAGAEDVAVRRRWADFARATDASRVIHARQVHEATVRVHQAEPGTPAAPDPMAESASRFELAEPCDGHATAVPGVVVAVTTADCVPVFVVDPRRRAIAVLHAGWRGAAAGVLERGLSTMRDAFGTEVSDLYVHFGPSICATCYEVGPEVFDAFDLPVPSGPTPLDLRGILAGRATEAGVVTGRITISAHCTRCTDSGLFSHRGGDAHRQVGFLGVRRVSAGEPA